MLPPTHLIAEGAAFLVQRAPIPASLGNVLLFVLQPARMVSLAAVANVQVS